MTVTTSYAPLTHNCNGSATTFNVTWPFFLSSDLVVTHITSAGVETVLTLTTDYTVSGGRDATTGLPAVGTITTVATYAAGVKIRITRATPKTQSTSFTTASAFPAKTVEAALDRVHMIAEESSGGPAFQDIDGAALRLETSGATNYWDAEDYILRNLAEPTAASDAATKDYVDTVVAGAAYPTPIDIESGGTGVEALTRYGVLVGNDTDAIHITDAGASGYALIGNGSANPTFQAFTQAGTGATSRTWQSKNRDIVDIRDFGASPSASAAANATAIQAALDYIATTVTSESTVFKHSFALYISGGVYPVTGTLTYTAGSIAIVGDGAMASTLKWTGAGGLAITLPTNESRFEIDGVGFFAAVANAGTAISVAGYTTTSSNYQNVIIRNCSIWSDYGASHWDGGIVLDECWHFQIDGCFLKGASTASDWWTTAIELKNKSIDGRITNTYIYGATNAVYVNSTTLEGLRIDGCSFVSVVKGVVKVASSGQPPHYHITNTHIAARAACLELNNLSSVMICDNLFYLGPQGGTAVPADATAVYLNDVGGAQIHGNQIAGRDDPIPAARYGILIGSSSTHIQVTNNYLALFTTGEWYQGGPGPLYRSGNVFFSCTTNIDDDASSSSWITDVVIGARDWPEISAPGSPAANNLRWYVADNGGTTTPYVRDSAGTVTNLLHPTQVTAASTFGTDNRLIRSDGTGRGAQSTGITVDDSDSLTTPGVIYADDSTSVSAPVYSFDGDANTGIAHPGADTVAVSTGGSERVRVDSSGNVGIGTNNPASFSAKLVAHKASGSTRIEASSAGSTGSDIGEFFCLGGSYFTYLQQQGNGSATVYGNATGMTIGTSAVGDIFFYTSGAEVMRVSSGSELLIGYTSDNGAYKLQVNSQIFATSATVATSDARFKENVADITDATSILAKLRPVAFDWKAHAVHNFDTDRRQVGFLAQDVQTALRGVDWGQSLISKNNQGGEDFLGLAETKLLPVVVKALQEAIARIDALESEIRGQL